MGGIADYSGSLVLQMPIREACHVALQRQPVTRCAPFWPPAATAGSSVGAEPQQPANTSASSAAVGPQLRILSRHSDGTHRNATFVLPLAELYRPGGEPLSYDAARALFRRDPKDTWAAYVAGCLVVLAHERGVRFDKLGGGSGGGAAEGLALLVSSDVPEGKGVSSSAAVEVATMCALLPALGLRLEGGGRELALLCQKVENLVVGAPCGIMDQMASALGQAGGLLALLCQPAEVQGVVAVPPGLAFWGVDSGVRHSVGGSDYGSVRVGAFMGKTICDQLLAASSASDTGGQGGCKAAYLVNTPPSAFAALEPQLPAALTGADFLGRYGSHGDEAVTRVEADKTYAVAVPARHPVNEHFRVQTFRELLTLLGQVQDVQRAASRSAQQGDPEAAAKEEEERLLCLLGEMMLQSHASYSACGLGSVGTDRLVALVLEHVASAQRAGRAPVLYGAKITGGGCGGTVCIAARATAAGEQAVRAVVEEYAKEVAVVAGTDDAAAAPRSIKVFSGSSVGAVGFGFIQARLRPATSIK